MVRKVLAGVLLVLAAGCTSPHQDRPRQDAAPPRAVPHAVSRVASKPGALMVPAGLRLPSISSVKAAQSWTDRLATLTAEERGKLESLNARYYGVLEFNDPDEQKELVAAGVPMPEEWIAASKMSDLELARLANARSPKGAMFFADRQVDRFIEAEQRLAGTGVDDDFDRDVINARAQALVYASKALAITRQPFAAYLYGSVGERIYGEPEYRAAAISVALALGDQRARDYSLEYMRQREWTHAPALNLGALAAIEAVMWMEVHRYRPL